MKLDQENIIKILGIESLPDDQKLQLLDQMGQLIEQRLLLRLYKELPEPKRNDFNQLLAANDPQKVEEFIHANVPEFTAWVDEEANALKDELSNLESIDKELELS
jgi:hypothetical protein